MANETSHKYSLFNRIEYVLPPPTKLEGGYVFTHVCLLADLLEIMLWIITLFIKGKGDLFGMAKWTLPSNNNIIRISKKIGMCEWTNPEDPRHCT